MQDLTPPPASTSPLNKAPLHPETTAVSGPAWVIQTEYPSMVSNEFAHDLACADELATRVKTAVAAAQPLIARIDADTDSVSAVDKATLLTQLQAISEMIDQAETLYGNLITFASCESDVDAGNEDAFKMRNLLIARAVALNAELKPVELFLERMPEELLQQYLQHPHTSPEEYSIRRARLVAANHLGEDEETLLARFYMHGPHAWSNLYSQISGTLKCELDAGAPGGAREIGLAQTTGLLRSSDEPTRKTAWHAIQNAWKYHETSCAAVLNNLAGWRLEETKRRSRNKTTPLHFLDQPVHLAGINRGTLDAMMTAVAAAQPVAHRAMRALAKQMGKTQLDPWDILAGLPRSQIKPRTYAEGLHLIRDAFAQVDPSFADFVDTMEKNHWIEGRVLPQKRQGAYCTRFQKTRTPRVFQTYMGSLSDIRTLAHELGHAYHAWVMRDLARYQHDYPMTLAETASIFAETVLVDHLSQDPTATLETSWQDTQGAASHLLNIPARFEFEKAFYEKRATGASLSAKELSQLTKDAWDKWYGTTLSFTEEQFWMTKLHFSISGISFYNFPYTFGSLFSLSIYARRAQLGSGFFAMYNALLRDTGRMTAEDLAMKHLGEDISKPEFWAASIQQIDTQVARFEKLIV